MHKKSLLKSKHLYNNVKSKKMSSTNKFISLSLQKFQPWVENWTIPFSAYKLLGFIGSSLYFSLASGNAEFTWKNLVYYRYKTQIRFIP